MAGDALCWGTDCFAPEARQCACFPKNFSLRHCFFEDAVRSAGGRRKREGERDRDGERDREGEKRGGEEERQGKHERQMEL